MWAFFLEDCPFPSYLKQIVSLLRFSKETRNLFEFARNQKIEISENERKYLNFFQFFGISFVQYRCLFRTKELTTISKIKLPEYIVLEFAH